MKRTTLFIDEAVDRELHVVARRQGVPVSALVRESLSAHLEAQRRARKLELRFLGRGRSGRQDIAERHEELLWHDRRDFRRVRPKHVPAFELLP